MTLLVKIHILIGFADQLIQVDVSAAISIADGNAALYGLIRIRQICLRISFHFLDEKTDRFFRDIGKEDHKLITAHSECSGVF